MQSISHGGGAQVRLLEPVQLAYDGNTVVSSKSPLLPESLNPEFIISDLQLVQLVDRRVAKKPPAAWCLEEADKKRFLPIRGKKQVEVNYLSPISRFGRKPFELVNFQC